jgi:hypothetical protein
MTGRQFLTGRHFLSGVLIALLCSIQPVFANGSSLQQTSTKPAPKRPVDPYQKLFQQPRLDQVARALQRAQDTRSSAPRVERGMAVIPLDPCIDPKIFAGQKPICR